MLLLCRKKAFHFEKEKVKGIYLWMKGCLSEKVS